ncbi:hypothetical protein BaRGS_00039858 [Batillaria attramentaria]|uniref:Uncharacterized protein n=1 Tax=Batillaria attramentaria TaxID=370345 RepID=A0ABD0J2G6_9CAEN
MIPKPLTQKFFFPQTVLRSRPILWYVVRALVPTRPMRTGETTALYDQHVLYRQSHSSSARETDRMETRSRKIGDDRLMAVGSAVGFDDRSAGGQILTD